ncbi:hypothetical protein NUW58_g4268 [Xylaria curta]|uniref:Uncharacterized protein n=1 Tax=Xylaria curta TaxID=42375 RepID=A0ACC1P739_9PEZI|nr:hypothetical protein NUW58_g4268 [Xylaria curta]
MPVKQIPITKSPGHVAWAFYSLSIGQPSRRSPFGLECAIALTVGVKAFGVRGQTGRRGWTGVDDDNDDDDDDGDDDDDDAAAAAVAVADGGPFPPLVHRTIPWRVWVEVDHLNPALSSPTIAYLLMQHPVRREAPSNSGHAPDKAQLGLSFELRHLNLASSPHG